MQPTTLLLQPGESRTYALRFSLVGGGPAERDRALVRAGRLVLHGVPGFVLAPEMSGGAKLLVERPEGSSLEIKAVASSDAALLSADVPAPVRKRKRC